MSKSKLCAQCIGGFFVCFLLFFLLIFLNLFIVISVFLIHDLELVSRVSCTS